MEEWKTNRAEAEMRNAGKEIMEKALKEKEEREKLTKVPQRDLLKELSILTDLNHDKCADILDWTETLPIHLLSDNTDVSIKQGVVTIVRKVGDVKIPHVGPEDREKMNLGVDS